MAKLPGGKREAGPQIWAGVQGVLTKAEAADSADQRDRGKKAAGEAPPLSNASIGLATPGRSVCARSEDLAILNPKTWAGLVLSKNGGSKHVVHFFSPRTPERSSSGHAGMRASEPGLTSASPCAAVAR